MKNLLRTAEREIKSLQKKQSAFNGSGILEIYLDFSVPKEGIILAGGTRVFPEDKPAKIKHLCTIKGVPSVIYKRMMKKFNGGMI